MKTITVVIYVFITFFVVEPVKNLAGQVQIWTTAPVEEKKKKKKRFSFKPCFD